jgi:hypothetical protein
MGRGMKLLTFLSEKLKFLTAKQIPLYLAAERPLPLSKKTVSWPNELQDFELFIT